MPQPETKPASWATHRDPIVLLLLCSLATIVPLLVNGPSCGHDFDFHLLSWLETAHDWHHHLLDPQWLASANYEAGEPRFIFYPPMSWLLGAVLGGAGQLAGQAHGWTLAPIVFTWLSIFGAGLCVYTLAQTLASRTAATVASCLFVANPYLLFVAYERTAYGELLATASIALLICLSLRSAISVAWVALVVAGLWLTNAPSAVMGCYTLAFICLLRLIRERNWQNTWKAAAGCALGLGLAGVYLVPAVWQQRWVQIDRAVSAGMRVQDSFLFEHTGQQYHDQVLHTASVIAIILFGTGLLACAVVWMRKQPFPWLLAAVLGMALLLQFPISLPLWHKAPQLQFLQFAWRWLQVVSIVTACLLAISVSRQGSSRVGAVVMRLRTLMVAVTFALVAGSVWYCSHLFQQPCDEQDRVTGQLAAFYGGSGVEGTDEYTARGADNSAIYQDLPQVRLLNNPDAEEPGPGAGDSPEWPGASEGAIDAAPGSITPVLWEPESKKIAVVAREPSFAVLALMEYPNWRVLVNGMPINHRPAREDGLMTIPVSAGTSTITVEWMTSDDVKWGRACSGFALLVWIALYYAPRDRLRYWLRYWLRYAKRRGAA